MVDNLWMRVINRIGGSKPMPQLHLPPVKGKKNGFCMSTSLASQTPPLFEIGWWEGNLVNRVDFSVPAKEFGRRCWYEN